MPDQPDHHYDVFVSFADADRDWVEGYLLPAHGLPQGRVITNQRTSGSESFQPGAAIVNEFERAVTSSRYTLLVLTRSYLADQWSNFGEQLASFATVAEQRNRLIPLLRERDCSLPLSEPSRNVAKRYGSSDVRLGKVCKALWVPVPGRGYWAKKAAGRPTNKRPPVPSLPSGREQQ